MASLEHTERLSRALAAGESVGITQKQMFPPLFRVLAKLGLPVRPLHFLPAWIALIVFAALGGVLFAGFWWVLDLLGAQLPRKFVAIHTFGALNMAMIGALFGGVITVFIRFQSLSRGLPHWREL